MSVKSNQVNERDVDVLYQKIGNRWYAFSMIGDEIFTGSLSEEEVQRAQQQGLEKFIEISDSSNGEMEIA